MRSHCRISIQRLIRIQPEVRYGISILIFSFAVEKGLAEELTNR